MLNLAVTIFTHPVFTAIIGFFIGHYLSIGRDRRNDFNKIAVPINIKLQGQIESLESNHFVDSFVSDDEFKELGLYFSKRKLKKYKTDLKEYKKIITDSFGRGPQGKYLVKNLTSYIEKSYKMLSYAKKK